VIFASRGSKPRKYIYEVLRWRGAKNIGIYSVFLFREREKSRKHRLFDAFWGFAKTVGLTILGGLQKVPTTKITTTTTTGPSSNNYNNNNNNDDNDDAAADDDEDDDNNDNDDNDDSYLVQMKSRALFPSPDPYRHRRCAKLYNMFIALWIRSQPTALLQSDNIGFLDSDSAVQSWCLNERTVEIQRPISSPYSPL